MVQLALFTTEYDMSLVRYFARALINAHSKCIVSKSSRPGKGQTMMKVSTKPQFYHNSRSKKYLWRVDIISFTADFVRRTLEAAEGGHDWWHIHRVHTNAKKIAQTESVDSVVVELAALLHDIADAKFHDGDETIGPAIAKHFLETQAQPAFPNLLSPQQILHIVRIIENISFKGGKEITQFQSPELAVVQDADRLDAIGAIGIARTFNYGGFKGSEIFNPLLPPNPNMSKEEYKKGGNPSLNHFWEKLLLLKDRMNTETGRKMASERHAFMLSFLCQFFDETGHQPPGFELPIQ